MPSALAQAVAQQTGRPVQEVQQEMDAAAARAQGGRQYIPYAQPGDADVAPLYIGQGDDPSFSLHPGLPESRPAGNVVHKVEYLGHTINVTTPDYGKGYKVEIHTTWGHHPTADDIKKAQEHPNSVRMFLEVRDKDGKVLDNISLDTTQQTRLLGGPEGTKGHPAIGPATGDLSITMDPYAQDAEARKGGMTLIGGVPQIDKTDTVDNQLKGLYDLEQKNPKKLNDMKHELWLAGYYGQGTTLDQVNMNSITNDDIAAFGSLMTAAANYHAAGKKITWQELLDQQAADPSVKNKGPKDAVIPLTDPAAITKMANDTGTKVLGRAPTPEDVSSLVALIHGHDQSYGEAQNRQAPEGSGQSQVQYDPASDIEQWMRQHYPNEAMATDWGAAAQEWDSLLASSSPQPQIVSGPRG